MKKEHKVLNSIRSSCFSTYNSQFYDSFVKEPIAIFHAGKKPKKLSGKQLNIIGFIFLLFLLMTNHRAFAQGTILEIESEYFETERSVTIAKSKGFDSTKSYQLFVILDEPVLFDYTVSVLNYLSIWKEIPQYVAIGIPNENRWTELQAKKDETIEEVPFFKFMNNELESIPYVQNASFRTLIGHSLSARFALQFLFKNERYSGVVAISPPLIPLLQKEFCEYLSRKKSRDSYIYMCSGDQDLRFHKKFFLETRKKFDSNKTPNVLMEYFEEQRNTSHSLMPVTAVQNGLLFVLDDYFNLPSKGIEELSSEENLPDSLLEKSYSKIQEIYGLTPEFRTVDFQNFVELYISKSNFSEAHRLCDRYIDITSKGQVYDLIDAYYLKGLTFEEQKNYSSALTYYKKGYSIIPEEVLNKADFEEDIIRVEKILSKSKQNKKKQ